MDALYRQVSRRPIPLDHQPGQLAIAVPYPFEREGTNCENLPETHAYRKKLHAFMDETYPGRILLCEANQWPEDVRPYFGDGDEFHMGFHSLIMVTFNED